ncbi:unnamed protein product [Rotaria magnacalcarata]|uniref:Uncharacterized protein n=1 Tax=Rotaria magnacalcarata TaxID=392030 RepID=A0A816CWJ3_9BILA|nr:unnamed protein product [Rotaria magnacalcarata]
MVPWKSSDIFCFHYNEFLIPNAPSIFIGFFWAFRLRNTRKQQDMCSKDTISDAIRQDVKQTAHDSPTVERNFSGVTLKRVPKANNGRLRSSSQPKAIEVHVDRFQNKRTNPDISFLRSLSSDNYNGSAWNGTDGYSNVRIGVPYTTINKAGVHYLTSPSDSSNHQGSATIFRREELQRHRQLQQLRQQQRQPPRRQQQRQRRRPPLQPQPQRRQQRQRPPAPALQQQQQLQRQQQRPQRQQPQQQPHQQQQQQQQQLPVSNKLNKC